jgi:cytochrome d ubiquinol oxidase subunit I
MLKSLGALLSNSNVWVEFPHTVLAGFTTGAFFVLGISAFYLLRKKEMDFFRKSFVIALIFATVSSILLAANGHAQGQEMVRTQPMKMATAEALWHTEKEAPFSIFALVDEEKHRDIIRIGEIPDMLSILAYGVKDEEVKGILDLQAEYTQKYGPGNYIPNVTVDFFSFRLMVAIGTLMILLCLVLVFQLLRKHPIEKMWLLKVMPFAIALPYLANTFGWLLTEMGRQPWVVYGILKTQDAVSPILTPGMVWTSLIGFTLVYALLMGVDVYLLVKGANNIPAAEGVTAGSADDESFMK